MVETPVDFEWLVREVVKGVMGQEEVENSTAVLGYPGRLDLEPLSHEDPVELGL